MVITFGVVAVLILCMYGFWRSQRTNSLAMASSLLSQEEEELQALFSQRFQVADELATRSGDRTLQSILSAPRTSEEAVGAAYARSDQRIAQLQRELAKNGRLEEVQDLFVRLSAIEDEIVARYAPYQSRREGYQRSLTPRDIKRGARQFPVWEIGAALSARP